MDQFKLEDSPEDIGEREVNGIKWKLYEFPLQGLSVNMAISEKDNQGFVVLLQSGQDEEKNLYDEVFIPMVDSLTPAQ